ncbi:MAG TPA: hypothetical protein VLV76_29025 [Candidatus Acidoferrum sp.]|nr:hypothetical protein [Candidatus Acidoferrum sp.]
MRLLICEHVAGGGFLGQPLPASLTREGDMMPAALVKDVAICGRRGRAPSSDRLQDIRT